MNVMKLNPVKSAGITLISASILGFTSCGGSQQQQQTQAQAPQLATITVNYGTTELESAYPATIKGRTDIDIRPQVTGFITKVHVDEGQQVKKGQVLFTLDQVQYQAAVESAEAAVKVAQTAVSNAQLTADNKKKLYDKNIISEFEYQLAANSLAQAKAQLSQAQASLISARKNLAYTVVTSPCDGVVGQIPNREGSLASPSSAQALTTVSDNSQVYAYFSLNEKDILNLSHDGSKSINASLSQMPEVSLRLANGEVYPSKGKIATLSGVIDNTTGSASVRALFDNKSGMLRSGSTGSILIPLDLDSALIIPQKATYELQNLRYVYVLNDSNVAVSQAITINPVNDGKNFVVTSGLKPGDRVVIEGVGTKVREGVKVQPIDPETAEKLAAEAAAQQQAAAAAQAKK
jgi:membrane fusion protein (multidrug efflux system)